MRAGLSGSLNRVQNAGAIVSRRLQPPADQLAALSLWDAKAQQDRLAFAPQLVTLISVR